MTDVDTAKAVDFLERHFGHASVVTFDEGGCAHPQAPGAEASKAFMSRQPYRNYYFVIAARKDRRALGKPTKNEMIGSRYTWVDVDPPKDMTEPAALESWRVAKVSQVQQSTLPCPSLIVSSGRGLWMFWKLNRLVGPGEVEEINRGLAKELGGDSCHNIDRVARVPFTRNSKTGQISSVLREVDVEVDPGQLPRATPPSRASASSDLHFAVGALLTSIEDLNRWGVQPRTKRVIEIGHDPDSPKEIDNSRSVWLWKQSQNCCGAECRRQQSCLSCWTSGSASRAASTTIPDPGTIRSTADRACG